MRLAGVVRGRRICPSSRGSPVRGGGIADTSFLVAFANRNDQYHDWAASVAGRVSMAKNKAKRLPRLKSVDELVEFFDKHDMGDYWDRLPKLNLN
jgi:hypothetical protein